MSERHLDMIHIRDLQLRCIVGLYEEERRAKQDVVINITLYADYQMACKTDRIEDTVDYKALKKKVVELVEGSGFYLIERLAQSVADACFETAEVQRVEVTVDKPGALRYARSVAVEIIRERRHG